MPAVLDIPCFQEHSIDPHALARAAAEPMLIALRAHHIHEVPELADVPGILRDVNTSRAKALGHRLRAALEGGERLWVLAAPADAVADLERTTGPGAVLPLGGDGDDPRSVVAVRPSRLARTLVERSPGPVAAALLAALAGTDTLRLTRRDATALGEAGIAVRQRPQAARWVRDPGVLAYVIVFVYSSLRALPVMFVRGFTGSLWVLWTMDILTAIPYTWGVIAAITGRRWWVRAAGMLVTVVTFVAPYVYFCLHGRHYPPLVLVVVAAMIAGGVGLEVLKQARTSRVVRELRASPAGSARR